METRILVVAAIAFAAADTLVRSRRQLQGGPEAVQGDDDEFDGGVVRGCDFPGVVLVVDDSYEDGALDRMFGGRSSLDPFTVRLDTDHVRHFLPPRVAPNDHERWNLREAARGRNLRSQVSVRRPSTRRFM